MSGVRALLTRVAKLEAARATPLSPFEVAYGSFDAYADATRSEIAAGRLCSQDMPIVLECLRRMHRDQAWGAGRRTSAADRSYARGE
jgi:hypothetical protein